MTEQMKPGDAVLVRATYQESSTSAPRGPGAAGANYRPQRAGLYVTTPDGNYMLVRRSAITTEAAIRQQALRDAAALLRRWADKGGVLAYGLRWAADEVERMDEAREAPERSEGDG